MRIGFLRLLDAAPLIIAGHLGYFSAVGVSVSLYRQMGWMNARDHLLSGVLDASQAPLGMPIMSQIGRSGFDKPLVSVMNLGSGGNVFVVSRELAEAGVNSVATLAGFVESKLFHQVLNRTLIGSYVSTYSAQYYLLRCWLEAAGLSQERHIRLSPLLPMQVPDHLAHGYVDVCCLGEPWGTRCACYGWGTLIGATTDVFPNHPEKVLAVRERFADENPEEIAALVEAVLRATDFCRQPENLETLVGVLALPEYLNESEEIIRQSLLLLRGNDVHRIAGQGVQPQMNGIPSGLSPDDSLHRWDLSRCYPDFHSMEWFLAQMVYWNDLMAGPELVHVARRSVRTEFYQRASEKMGLKRPRTSA